MTKRLSFEEAVLAYKYSSPNLSLFEQLFLNEFWNWFVYFYPAWMAPNVITLIGGTSCMLMYLLSWYSSPHGMGEAQPQTMYLLFAALMFWYQTCDGSDGKRARIAQCGSALGELMDHGVDALVTGFISFTVIDALALGIDAPVVWISIVGGQMTFYMSNMTLLHRGKQTFFPIDIMELQWVLITVMAVAGLFGPKIWAETWVPVPHASLLAPVQFGANLLRVPDFVSAEDGGKFQARLIIVFGAVGGTVQNFFLYMYMSSTPYLPRGNALTHPGCGVFQLLRQIGIILAYGAFCAAGVVFVSQIESRDVRHSAYRAFLTASCFAFADLMDRLLVMRVSHMHLPTFSPTLACVALFALVGAMPIKSEQTQLVAYWTVALFSIACHQLFFVWIVQRLATVLNISVFKLKKKAD